ncbi:putative serine/threonine-protein kinase KIN1-like protein [Fusarium oxysporum f. sp. rapae]|uniref:Putative serine/threonine-protein kinase KIN1-like protein n=1 Tax=Fusarium oxysporum f. sp. rapae TaxID=485398 RepID=A0A8J5PF85_FUSOX|nr:putative serine/threonine-protein kinase KIN1-like protein [Fusarium oxysporum f. sp. rapae]
MGDMVETQAMDDVAVYELHSGTGDGADIVFAFNGCLISVSIFPSNGSSTKDTQGQEDRPLQDHLIDLIEKATVCQDDDEYEELVDEVFAVILDAGRPLFCQLISSRDEQALSKSLHHFLYPPFFHFLLDAPNPTGSVSIIPISSSETNTIRTVDPASDPGFQEELEICQDLPRYTPEEVFATEVFKRGTRTVTAAVQVQGQDMFCKSSGESRGLYGISKERELECLDKLKDSPLNISQVPRLLGYIHHKDTKQILGFLRQWVPGCRLSDIIISSTAQNKHKWASQVRQTIETIHRHGLIWGDGKPSNIIIDEQDNAWLIDFGGGYRRGWIDEDLAETKEGDEQALEKIVELLSGGENMPSSS